jgi:hypothetical protein
MTGREVILDQAFEALVRANTTIAGGQRVQGAGQTRKGHLGPDGTLPGRMVKAILPCLQPEARGVFCLDWLKFPTLPSHLGRRFTFPCRPMRLPADTAVVVKGPKLGKGRTSVRRPFLLMKFATDRLHASGAYLTFTQAGADLFA